jgi:hypothetical protein
MGVGIGEAVRWIAERFKVPDIKRGRPLGHHAKPPSPYRIGVRGSELEVLVRSGMFGELTAPARTVLVVLHEFRDPDSGITRMSYRAIMRYAGVAGRTSVSRALKELARFHAIEVHQGARLGITRECSAYRVTLDAPKFLEVCNQTYRIARAEIAEEREYRTQLRTAREQRSRRVTSRPVAQDTNTGGGLRPPDPLGSFLSSEEQDPEANPTCTSQHLSPLVGLNTNKAVHAEDREIGVSGETGDPETRRRQLFAKAGTGN